MFSEVVRLSIFGEVAEWTKALALSASRQVYNLSRGFKSHPLRHSYASIRARWGVSGALHLQSATAGSNSETRYFSFGVGQEKWR